MQGRRESRPFPPLGEDEALGTLGGQNQDQTQGHGEVAEGVTGLEGSSK